MLAANEIVRHLTTWDLPAGRREPLNLALLSERLEPGAVATSAVVNRVTGPVLAALEGGALTGVGDRWLSASTVLLGRACHDQLRSGLSAEADAINVVEALRSAGIDTRVLKGTATANLDYTDPVLRVTSDADILVPEGALGDATAALADIVDSASTLPEWRRDWTDRFGKARTLRLRSGGWLDLHQRIEPATPGSGSPRTRSSPNPNSFGWRGSSWLR